MSFSKGYLYISNNNISLSVYFSSQACKLLELSAVLPFYGCRGLWSDTLENPLGLFWRSLLTVSLSNSRPIYFRTIRRRSDYITGFVTPAIGPNKSKKLTRLVMPAHNIRGKVWMKSNMHGFTDNKLSSVKLCLLFFIQTLPRISVRNR